MPTSAGLLYLHWGPRPLNLKEWSMSSLRHHDLIMNCPEQAGARARARARAGLEQP
jgi:hypothetical protein